MTEKKEEFKISDKFKDFEDQGISAPQVLTFLDNIATMLKVISTDIQKAINNIEMAQEEEAKETTKL